MELKPEAFLLRQLFIHLNNAQVRYAVMRNYKSLPNSAGGSDLDLIIDDLDEQTVRKIIIDVIYLAGGVPIGISDTSGFFKIYSFGNINHVWWGIRIDVNVGLYFRGHNMFPKNYIFPIDTYNGIKVLPYGFSGVLGVIKEVLHNDIYPDRYAFSARQAALNDWHSIEQMLNPLGCQSLNLFKTLCQNDISNKKSICKNIRNAFLGHAFIENPFIFLSQRFKYEWSKVKRYIFPSGIVLAILGTDGAGKSTIINAILPVLNEATHNAVIVQHLRPTLVPPLSRLKGKNVVPVGPILDPHGRTPSGKVLSFVRLIYLMFDYILGYWLKIRPSIAKQPTVVVFDRYAYDMAIDQRRFRINLPSKLVDWFTALAPKPDLIVCLYGDPTEIAVRKQELPLEEVKRQTAALLAFAAERQDTILVSTTESSVEEVRDKVLQAILEYCVRKAKGRNYD